MFKYNDKEYRTKTDAINYIVEQASSIQNDYKRADRIAILETISKHQEIIHELNNRHNAIQEEAEKASLDYIKQEESKITNQGYQFIPTGFFIEGTIESITETEMVMKHNEYQYIAYEILRHDNQIFTKPKTIEVKRYYDAPLRYHIIGIENYYLILKTDNNIILATSNNRDGVRTRVNSTSIDTKIQGLKRAIIPLEEDRTFVSKWLMRNTNKE